MNPLETLFKATKRHSAAFFWAKDVFKKKNGKYILEQGTITFIEYKDKCYAVTNQHVLGEGWRERLTKEHLMVGLKKHSFWAITPIFVSPPRDRQFLYPAHFPKDIVIFPWSNCRAKLFTSEKTPVKLPGIIPVIKEGDVLLAVGFPGGERKIVGRLFEHKMAHIFGTVRSVSENRIILQDTNPPKDKDINFGGISGGAIYKIEDDDNYSFVGIIYQGRGHIYKNDHGETVCGNDIWVFGHPFDGMRLEQMLKCALLYKN